MPESNGHVHQLALSQGEMAFIDPDDFDRDLTVQFQNGDIWSGKVCDRPWRSWSKKGEKATYVVTNCRVATRRHFVFLHRLIMQTPPDLVCHHEDGDGLNNIRANLTVLSVSDHNKKSAHGPGIARERRKGKPKTSKYKGVMWDPLAKRWRSQIKARSKYHFIGRFDDEVAAAKAYDTKARELWGSKAKPNFTT